MRKFFIFILFFINFSVGLEIRSNYPLPHNNIKEVFKSLDKKEDIIKILKKTDSFKDIELKNNTLYLSRYPLLKEIYIKGNDEYWDSTLKGIAGIYEGKYISNQEIFLIPLRLKRFYFENGYINANINVNFRVDKKGNGKLIIRVKEGKLHYIKDVDFISDIDIPLKIKKAYKKVLSLNDKRFQFSKIEEKLDKLLSFIKKRGYYDAYVTIHSFYPAGKENIILFIDIVHGLKYQIQFIGNYHVRDEVLKKFAPFYVYGVNYQQIFEFAQRIKEFYKSIGFLDADVDFNYVENLNRKKAYIKIYIYEGKRYKIKNVKLNSDHKLPEHIQTEIKSLIGRYYNKTQIYKTLQKYIDELHKQGYKNAYFNVSILDKEKEYLLLSVTIYKGKQFVIENVEFVGYKPKLDLNLPTIYKSSLLIRILNEIKNRLISEGYLDADVKMNVSLKEKKNKILVYVKYNVYTGKLYYTDVPFFYGTWHLKTAVLKWNIKSNLPFTKKLFNNQLNFLFSSYLFNFVNPDVLINKKNKKVNQIFVLSEDKRGLVQGSFGYNSVEKFKGSLSLVLKNLFDYGFEFNGYIDKSSLYTNYNLSFGNRLLPKYSSLFFSVFSSLENHRYYDLTKKGTRVEYMKRPNKWAKQILSLEYSDNKLKNTSVYTKNPYKKYQIFFGLEYDHRNNKIYPTGGFYFRGNFGRTFKDVEYFFGNFSFRYYYRLYSFVWTQNLAAGGNFISIYKLPISERYFLGGLSTIRGFGFEKVSNNKIGGNSYAYINTDIRFPIIASYNLYGFLFYDMGNVFPTKKAFFHFRTRKSAGLGILVPTPAGAFIFDYAFILDKKAGENKYRIEFSINVVF